jgi:hypothetical protein
MFVAVAVALTLGAVLVGLFARVASRAPERVNLGSRVFDLGKAEARVEQATEGPLVFNDLIRDSRPVALAVGYLGDDRWIALNLITDPSQPRCAARWDRSKRRYENPCNGVIYAPDGTPADPSTSKPLQRYAVEVTEKDRLVVDLNRAPSDET